METVCWSVEAQYNNISTKSLDEVAVSERIKEDDLLDLH